MPGIVTHNRIFKESILFLKKKEKRNFLLNSINALFENPSHMTAGLFGTIGPNIFDYIPFQSGNRIYGSDISFFIHNGGLDKLLQHMIDTLYNYGDKNNEWASTQRAYIYGFISHIVADSIFHPFIFYYSGFPAHYTKKEIHFFREQNLIFQYNLDNYFQFHDDKLGDFTFSIDEMLPVSNRGIIYGIDRSIKSLIMDSMKETYPEIHKKLLIYDLTKYFRATRMGASYIDWIPRFIKITYSLKRNANRRMGNIFRYLLRNGIIYSDFIVRYPINKRYNKQILNLQRQRWDHPAGKPGLHYESIQNLMLQSCEKTVELWEKIESSLYGEENLSIFDDLAINAYTGDAELSYHDMKIKEPVRLTL